MPSGISHLAKRAVCPVKSVSRPLKTVAIQLGHDALARSSRTSLFGGFSSSAFPGFSRFTFLCFPRCCFPGWTFCFFFQFGLPFSFALGRFPGGPFGAFNDPPWNFGWFDRSGGTASVWTTGRQF